MRSTNASVVCTNKAELKKSIELLLNDVDLQKAFYKQQIEMTEEHHSIRKSCAVSESVINEVIKKSRKH